MNISNNTQIRNQSTLFFLSKLLQRVVIVLTIPLLLSKFALADPLTMNEAVQRAIEIDPQAQIGSAIVDEARGMRTRAINLPSPRLSGRWDNIPVNRDFNFFRERRIGISQEFDFPLKYYWRVKSANLKIKSAQNDSCLNLQELKKDIRKLYLEMWFLASQIDVLSACRDSLESYAQRAERASVQGHSALAEARYCRAKASEALLELNIAQSGFQAVRENLALRIGLTAGEIEPVNPFESNPVDTIKLDIDALMSSPIIQSTRYTSDALDYQRKAAIANYLPNVQLTYFGRQEFVTRDPDSWAFEVELSIPLWFWWESRGRMQIAKSELHRARAEADIALLEIKIEYNRLSSELKAGVERLELHRRELLPLAGDQYATVLRQYYLGNGSFSDLTDERTKLKKKELDFIELQKDLYEVKIELDGLLGN